MWQYTLLPLISVGYLDAVLIEKARQGETFLLVKGLAKDNQLLKEEDSPLLHPAKHTALWVRHHECVLQQKAALSHNLALEREKIGFRRREMKWCEIKFLLKITSSAECIVLIIVALSFIIKYDSYIKSLKPADVHHIVTPFWHDAHDLNCFLQELQMTKGLVRLLHTFCLDFERNQVHCIILPPAPQTPVQPF